MNAHQELRKAGYELWGEGQDAYVPLLQSRNAVAKKKDDAPVTSPVVG